MYPSSQRRLLPFIYPSLLRDGVTLRVECGFSHSIVTKSALDSWSVFLQDGVTPVGSGSVDLISNEGITSVGFLGAFFLAILRVSLCHPLVGQSALKRGGFHVLLSSLLARTRCVSL